MKKLSELKSKSDAVNARKKGKDVLATNRQKSGEIERAASEGKDVLKHKGHDLPDGSKGRPHHQTDGKPGYTLWGTSLLIIWDLLNPFDIIAGELADDELDMLKEFYNRNNPNSVCK